MEVNLHFKKFSLKSVFDSVKDIFRASQSQKYLFTFNIFLLAKILLLLCYYFIAIAFFSFPLSPILSLADAYTKSIEGNIENALFSLFYYKKTFEAARGCGFYKQVTLLIGPKQIGT